MLDTVALAARSIADNEQCFAFHVKFTCDDSHVISTTSSGSVVALNTASGLAPSWSVQGAHSDKITGLSVDASDARLLWTGGHDGRVRLWDLRSQQAAATMHLGGNGSVECVTRSNGGVAGDSTAHLLAVGAGPVPQVWDIRRGAARHPVWAFPDVHTEPVTCVQFAPPGLPQPAGPLSPGPPTSSVTSAQASLLTGSEDGLVCQLDLLEPTSGVGRGQNGVVDDDAAIVLVLNDNAAVSQVGCWGPQRQFAFSRTCSETLSLWNLADATLALPTQNIRSVLQLDSSTSAPAAAVDYVVDCWWDQRSASLWTLAGSHYPHSLQNQQLHLFQFSHTQSTWKLWSKFSQGHSPSAVVRGADRAAANSQHLVTCAEDGTVVLWRTSTNDTISSSSTGPTASASATPSATNANLPAASRTTRYKPY